MGNQYGPYVMYFLSQLLQRQKLDEANEEAEKADVSKGKKLEAAEAEASFSDLFAYDETESCWHKETNIELLRQFCPEGFASAQKYGHFIIGQHREVGVNECYIGIPGRFLIDEQPAGGKSGFTLWQPIKGGEEFFDSLETIEAAMADSIYGYWIAALEEKTLKISEA